MGKRELLLIAGFLIAGAIVYQATAPDADPGSRGASLSSVLAHVRREIAGNRAHAEVTSRRTIPVSDATTELRLEASSRGQLNIVGEDRQDIECEFHVRSNGFDEAEARQLAEATKLVVNDGAANVVLQIDYPSPGRQWATLTLKVPARLQIRIKSGWNHVEIANVAAAELVEARGQVTLRNVAHRVSATHHGGVLTVEGVGESLKLNTRGSDVRLRQVRGETTLQIRGGEVQAAGLEGPIEIDAASARVTLEELMEMRGSIRISAVGGTLRLYGVGTDTRIDSRNTAIELTLERAVTIAVNSEGRQIDITQPPAGFQLDAVATDGRLTLPEALLEIETTGNTQRAAGAVRGGGPILTLRSSRGDIIVRSPPHAAPGAK